MPGMEGARAADHTLYVGEWGDPNAPGAGEGV